MKTVVYNLPPDLSVYGTWQLQENATLKIKFDKSYVYTVNSEDTKVYGPVLTLPQCVAKKP